MRGLASFRRLLRLCPANTSSMIQYLDKEAIIQYLRQTESLSPSSAALVRETFFCLMTFLVLILSRLSV